MPAKGQTLSPEAIERMKENKIKRLRAKYKWILIEPYLDEEINMSSRNRNKKFISLREFKDFIEDGNSLKEINKITSKHLVQFYSNLSQGKISLSKKDFEKEYEKGLSLEEIAEKHKISKDDMTFLRQLYGLKVKGAKYINRKKTEVPLTDRQKQILYGSMMGDACRMGSSSVKFKHGQTQKDFLLWKYKEFESVASPNSLKGEKYIDKRSEYEGESWFFYTYANTDIERCIRRFYSAGEKEISKEVLSNLTALSVAIWYMDDGVVDFRHRTKVKKDWNVSPIYKFCTESFSKESCENIREWFYERFGIETELVDRSLSDRMGYRIKVKTDSIDSFVNIIRPHILPMFQYKIDYEKYMEKRKDREKSVVSGECLECPLGADFSNLSLNRQDNYIENLVKFYQKKGISSLVERPSKWENSMSSVISSDPENLIRDDYIAFSNLGNKFLMSHFPNFWEAKAKGGKSPKEIFENKGYLSDVIRGVIVQGYFPSPEKILKALQRYRGNKQVSGFMPCVAKAIYHKYCDDDSRVFDFCAGYGGRLFGAIACNKVKSYTCSEVNFKTYSNLHDLYRTLRLFADIDKEVNIFNQDSILAMKQFADKSFDFCFTSPPYYDAEVYEDGSGQSISKYGSYSQWFNNYLIEAIREAMRISGKVAINIANTGGYMIADDLEKWLKSETIPYKMDRIRLPYYGGEKFEPIFVM